MLKITTHKIDDTIVLDVSGRIDAINSPLLQEKIDTILENNQGHLLLLRMIGVNYLSAAGLRVLRLLKEATGQVRIVEPSKRVIEVMEMTGLDAVYGLYISFDEALRE